MSDVVCAFRVEDADTFEGLVTPSSVTITASPAVTLLPDEIVQTSTVCELTPHVPTCVPASVTKAFVIERVLEPLGRAIVIWLCAVADIPPVVEVLKVMA